MANGVYLNLVEDRLWVPVVVGSNPTTPTETADGIAQGLMDLLFPNSASRAPESARGPWQGPGSGRARR